MLKITPNVIILSLLIIFLILYYLETSDSLCQLNNFYVGGANDKKADKKDKKDKKDEDMKKNIKRAKLEEEHRQGVIELSKLNEKIRDKKNKKKSMILNSFMFHNNHDGYNSGFFINNAIGSPDMHGDYPYMVGLVYDEHHNDDPKNNVMTYSNIDHTGLPKTTIINVNPYKDVKTQYIQAKKLMLQHHKEGKFKDLESTPDHKVPVYYANN